MKDSFISPWIKQTYNTFTKLVSVIQLKDSTFLGVDSNGILWRNLDLFNGGKWVQLVISITDAQKVKSITQLNDGSFICIDFYNNSIILKKQNLMDLEWTKVGEGYQNIVLKQIIQKADNTFLAVNNNSGLYTKKNLTDSTWVNLEADIKSPEIRMKYWWGNPKGNMRHVEYFIRLSILTSNNWIKI